MLKRFFPSFVLMAVVVLGIEFSLYPVEILFFTKGTIPSARIKMLEDDQIHDSDRFRIELSDLYGRYSYQVPYRWFALPQNYRGKYFNTDEKGVRSNGTLKRGEGVPLIGFWGGSTMFSTTTPDFLTIPAIFAQRCRRKIETRNFGVGNYSSSAELGYFIEVIRREPIDIAVFYDGANEIGRYLEFIQQLDREMPPYDVMGFYSVPYWTAAFPYFPQMSKAVNKIQHIYQSRIAQKSNANMIINAQNADHHAKKILDIYKTNMSDHCCPN